MSYSLKLFHDEIAPEVTANGLEAQHSIIYVWKGSVTVNGRPLRQDSASYFEDFTLIQSGPQGATLWRWEIVPDSAPLGILKGEGIRSLLQKSRKIRMFELVPTSKWIFRLDSIIDHMGSTGLHSHPGSGIRCLISGNLSIRSEKGENSDNRTPGDSWYEEGSYPLVSTAEDGVKTTFLRGMVLPPEYDRYPDTAMWIEGTKPCKSEWKSYAQKVITLR